MVTNIYSQTRGAYVTVVVRQQGRFHRYRLIEPLRQALRQKYAGRLQPIRGDRRLIDNELVADEVDAADGIIANLYPAGIAYRVRLLGEERGINLTAVEVKSILNCKEYARQL